jgi:hypothetical protein
LKSVDPALTELREIQSKVLTILRRAKSERDYDAALAAAAQAVANAQLIGAMTERQQAAEAGELAKSAMDETQSPAQFFLIALKDKSINAVTSYWVDGLMLNYLNERCQAPMSWFGWTCRPWSLSRAQPPTERGVPPSRVISC